MWKFTPSEFRWILLVYELLTWIIPTEPLSDSRPFASKRVGILLSRYKSGPLPRALKILPSLPHWAQLLALTDPAQWTPHAAYACTRIFVSNLKPAEVQVFLQGILLDQVRDNIADQERAKSGKGGRLDVQLYEALKKGLYKPAAWFKGILFPLCEVSRVLV